MYVNFFFWGGGGGLKGRRIIGRTGINGRLIFK
jgi:hypothetical protein